MRRVQKDLPAILAQLERRVIPVQQAILVRLERWVLRAPPVPRARRLIRGQLERWVLRGQMELRGQQASAQRVLRVL